MSSEAISGSGASLRSHELFDASTRHALRIAGGMAIPFVIGEALGWDLPFIASIFALMMLSTKQPPLKLAAAIASVAGIAAAFLAALLLTRLTLASPVAFITTFGLALFAGLYGQQRSASPIWFFFLVAVTVTPLMAAHSQGLATTVARIMILGMAIAILAAWLMHALFPEPTLATGGSAPVPPPGLPRPAAEDRRVALIGTLIVVPLVLFLLSRESAALVVTITVLSILRTAGFAEGKRAVLGILLGNLIAGGVAIVAYFMIDAASSLLMLALIILAVSLFFGERIANGGPSAPLYVGAGTAALVLLGLGLSPFNDATTAFASRVVYVFLASAYALGMIALLASLYPRPHDQPAQSGESS